jgi:membrane fusion protein, heavy metal efflux system
MKRLITVLFAATLLASCSRPKPEEHVKEEEAKERQAKTIEMSAEAQGHIALQTTYVGLKNLSEYLQVTGTVQPIDTRIAHVRPLAKGRVQQILVRVGDRVQEGQELARFDNIEAGELLAQFEGARTELQRLRLQQASAARQEERNRRLSDIGAVPKKDYELSQVEEQSSAEYVKTQESVVAGLTSRLRRFGVEQVNVNYPSTVIRSPFTGVVIKAETAPGEVIDVDRELFSIADLSHIWVQAEVYEKDLGRVQLGQSAFITVDTYEQKFTGKVTYIGDILDPQTRTARVRCEVANPDTQLKLDMFATVALPTHFSRRALAVPTSAIQQIDRNNVVFVRVGRTRFDVRRIQTGPTINDLTEVKEGLAAGEEIVQQGSFHLKSIALSGQIGEQ